MVFPVVLRGQPEPRLATTPTKSTTSKPVVPGDVLLLQSSRRMPCHNRPHGAAQSVASPQLADESRADSRRRADAAGPAGEDGTPPPADTPPSGPRRSQTRLRRIFGPLIVVGAAILRFLGPLKGLLIALPKLKLLTTSGSMLVSVGAYALIWGWKFALGFVLLLLVHELGHVIQLRREGIHASAPMFIPFLGAVVTAKSLGDDAAAEARVGLAGPILGSLGAALLLPVWLGDRRRVLAGARVHGLLPQPLQPAARRAAGRRPRDGGDDAVDVVRRARCDDRRRDRLPQPDHHPDRDLRRVSRRGGAGRRGERAARRSRRTTASSRRSGSRSAPSTSA